MLYTILLFGWNRFALAFHKQLSTALQDRSQLQLYMYLAINLHSILIYVVNLQSNMIMRQTASFVDWLAFWIILGALSDVNSLLNDGNPVADFDLPDDTSLSSRASSRFFDSEPVLNLESFTTGADIITG